MSINFAAPSLISLIPRMAPSVDLDPLALAIAPPDDETPDEKEAREFAEAEALRVSNEIDEQIRRERDRERKRRRPVKLLLLGQSESGKTATLKNFQLIYARREWLEELNAWRPVVFFNLVRNVNSILDILAREMSQSTSTRDTIGSSDESSEDFQRDMQPPLKFREKHRLLKLRLAPLRRVQTDLERRLGSTAVEPRSTDVTTAAPFGDEQNRRVLQEFSINSSNGWKSALEKIKLMRNARAEATEGSLRKVRDVDDEIAEVIAGCRDDIKAIWEDSTVRELLSRSKMSLEDKAGFFLNDVDRIAATNYQPSDDDVIRARLRTLGVQEYKFIFENGRAAGQEWRLYDVGGTRSSKIISEQHGIRILTMIVELIV
ncbi:hypothetical protein D9758_006576 [Tetrapyrgos nigripes]|uniref:Uncharacterized protein n=1 Tax=Tetrapyrgos nigripes TaxID=182062 RepID=A0A8H5GL99_9AGAR|nr:hypothetical protein D9758_006576 [Tetrapyrgos nigripes]